MKRRVVLKLSGEALQDGKNRGIQPTALVRIAEEIRKAHSKNIQLCVVIGGGNIWRGVKDSRGLMDRVTSDNMGMLATVINALALQDALEHKGVVTRVQTAIEILRLAEPFIRRRAIRHLEKGRVVIFAGGTGNPYFTTDTTAALRAVEIGADVLLKATHVDGVYTADPHKVKKARLLKRISCMEAIRKRLLFMDTSALSLCMENNIPIIVFNLHAPGNIRRVINDRFTGVGTRIEG